MLEFYKILSIIFERAVICGCEPETDGTQDVPKAPETGDTTDDTWGSWWIVLFWGVIMVIGSGVFFVMKKKESAEG